MKYSLRSLMIVVTLICVVLGGVTGRVEYLRQWAVYHELAAEETGSNVLEWDDHKYAAYQYRLAMWRPWTIVRPSMQHLKYHTNAKRNADEFWYEEQPAEKPMAPYDDEDDKWAAQVEKLRSEQSVPPNSSSPAPKK